MKKALKIAKQIARECHKGQKRFDGKDYITHPEAVAKLVGEDVELKTIAWLHDVVEDTKIHFYSLIEKGIPTELVCVIDILTRREEEDYFNYILRIVEDDKAVKVKIADLKHNLSNLKKGSLRDKYLLAKYILENLK